MVILNISLYTEILTSNFFFVLMAIFSLEFVLYTVEPLNVDTLKSGHLDNLINAIRTPLYNQDFFLGPKSVCILGFCHKWG